MEMYSCAGGTRLELTADEMEAAGLRFDTFGKGDDATDRFIPAVLSLLRDRGYFPESVRLIDIEVSETEGGMTLFITERKPSQRVKVVFFTEPSEFEFSLHELISDGEEPVCELRKLGGSYVLIASSESYPKSESMAILAARLAEHGTLLSREPYRLI